MAQNHTFPMSRKGRRCLLCLVDVCPWSLRENWKTIKTWLERQADVCEPILNHLHLWAITWILTSYPPKGEFLSPFLLQYRNDLGLNPHQTAGKVASRLSSLFVPGSEKKVSIELRSANARKMIPQKLKCCPLHLNTWADKPPIESPSPSIQPLSCRLFMLFFFHPYLFSPSSRMFLLPCPFSFCPLLSCIKQKINKSRFGFWVWTGPTELWFFMHFN